MNCFENKTPFSDELFKDWKFFSKQEGPTFVRPAVIQTIHKTMRLMLIQDRIVG
jgi:hypothetical protein